MFNKYFEAFDIASRAHRRQFRKVNGTPYISHPMAVAFILEKMGKSEDLVIAGVLHDVLEDTDISEDELTELFGSNVIRLVRYVTEDKTIGTWKERKQSYIDRIRSSDLDVKVLSMADKVHNLHSMNSDKSVIGNDLWLRFSAPKNDQKWYYETLLQVFLSESSLTGSSLVQEMQTLIELVFCD